MVGQMALSRGRTPVHHGVCTLDDPRYRQRVGLVTMDNVSNS